jgi:hypothetical protein
MDVRCVWVGFLMYNNIETLPDLPSAAPVHLRHYHVINTMIWVISQDDHHAIRLSSCTHHSPAKHAHNGWRITQNCWLQLELWLFRLGGDAPCLVPGHES